MSTETMTLAEHLAKFEAEQDCFAKLKLGNRLRARIMEVSAEAMGNRSRFRNRPRFVTDKHGQQYLLGNGEELPPELV